MSTLKPTVTRLRRILLVVGDLEAAALFFVEAFAFVMVERCRADPGLSLLVGLPGVPVRQTILRLGEQEIGLLAFDTPGRPQPAGGTSSDLWFQHFAIIVSDMAAAYRRLQALGRFTPISTVGPQTLPPGAGSVSAFKFRDAEGHPLELLAFPAGQEPPAWRDKAKTALFLGIDHSAIAVSDAARSIAFYGTCFGLTLGAETRNEGPAQSCLDAVPGAVVTVTGLEPAIGTPHVELLCYAVGTRRPIPADTRPNDRAASLLVLQTPDLACVVAALRTARARFVSPGIVTLLDGNEAICVLDPDGHRIVVVQ